jgi:hypothetical protein
MFYWVTLCNLSELEESQIMYLHVIAGVYISHLMRSFQNLFPDDWMLSRIIYFNKVRTLPWNAQYDQGYQHCWIEPTFRSLDSKSYCWTVSIHFFGWLWKYGPNNYLRNLRKALSKDIMALNGDTLWDFLSFSLRLI